MYFKLERNIPLIIFTISKKYCDKFEYIKELTLVRKNLIAFEGFIAIVYALQRFITSQQNK